MPLFAIAAHSPAVAPRRPRLVSLRGLGLLLLPLLATPALAAYTESLVLIPRVGQGFGTVSPYAGLTPTLAPNDVGHDVITLPASSRNEVNLLWTFWGHRSPPAEQWPAGAAARTVFTLTSPVDLTINPRVAVLAGSWTELLPGPSLALKAGVPTLVELPLPALAAPAAIERLRLNFTARGAIPELKIMGWSVGEGSSPPTAAHAGTAASSTSANAAAESIYTPQRTLVPLTGDGTVSDYADSRPRFEKDPQGFDLLRMPANNGAKEVNLLWTYWSHRRPASGQWPAGPAARASLTLRSAADVTLQTRLLVRTSDWSAPVAGPAVTLSAGQSQTIQLPLPDALPDGSVENLRFVLSSTQPIPELTVSYWSVGEEK